MSDVYLSEQPGQTPTPKSRIRNSPQNKKQGLWSVVYNLNTALHFLPFTMAAFRNLLTLTGHTPRQSTSMLFEQRDPMQRTCEVALSCMQVVTEALQSHCTSVVDSRHFAQESEICCALLSAWEGLGWGLHCLLLPALNRHIPWMENGRLCS